MLPSRIGFEATGVIESTGSRVWSFAAGDRVATLPMMELNKCGCYGELVTVPADLIVKAPETLTPVENAAVWSSYMAAYVGLVETAKVRPGDFVLITAASSSCGAPAIQIAKMLGAHPIAVERDRAKAEAVEAMAAQATIITEDEDLVDRVGQITGGKGVRVVFDPIGGPGVHRLLDTMAPYGDFVLYGLLDFTPIDLPAQKMMTKNVSLHAVAMYLTEQPQRDQRAVAFIREGIAAGALKPVIAKTFAFSDVGAAVRYYDEMHQVGKVVVTVPGGASAQVSEG